MNDTNSNELSPNEPNSNKLSTAHQIDNQVDIDDIFEVARLARLAINETTATTYANDISKILTMMKTIGDVDTEGLTPLSNIHEAAQELRADIPNPNIDRERNQSVAPAVEQGLYLVPQVIE